MRAGSRRKFRFLEAATYRKLSIMKQMGTLLGAMALLYLPAAFGAGVLVQAAKQTRRAVIEAASSRGRSVIIIACSLLAKVFGSGKPSGPIYVEGSSSEGGRRRCRDRTQGEGCGWAFVRVGG